MSDWARHFSRPISGTDEAVFDTIAGAYAGTVVSALLARHGDQVAQHSEGLTDLLESFGTQRQAFSTVWDLSFGRAHLALKEEGRLDPVDVGARVALRLVETGGTGSWSARVPATTFTVGNLFVDEVTDVSVDVAPGASGGRISLGRADGTTVELVRDAGSWTGQGAQRIRTVGIGKRFRLLSGPMLPPDAGSREVFEQSHPVAAIDEPIVETFQAGLDVLDELTPHFVPWIERVLQGVVVCTSEAPFHLTSGSWEDIPSYVHMSYPHAAIDIADILVHESSHQYFYLLEKVGPMDDGSDRTLYYSPATRTDRPISRLLMAFHAFVNVLEVYQAVKDKQTEDLSYVLANEPALLADIAMLDEPLRTSAALTDLGRSIYEPLAERLSVLSS